MILYTAKISNVDKNDAAVAAERANPTPNPALNTYPEVFTQPEVNNPPYYFPPLLGGRALLGKVESVIDTIRLTDEDSLEDDPHYTVLNRKYCSGEIDIFSENRGVPPVLETL